MHVDLVIAKNQKTKKQKQTNKQSKEEEKWIASYFDFVTWGILISFNHT